MVVILRNKRHQSALLTDQSAVPTMPIQVPSEDSQIGKKDLEEGKGLIKHAESKPHVMFMTIWEGMKRKEFGIRTLLSDVLSDGCVISSHCMLQIGFLTFFLCRGSYLHVLLHNAYMIQFLNFLKSHILGKTIQ